MEVISTAIPDVKLVIPRYFGDSRGYFVETYNAERYKAAGITADFVQDNESCSMKGVVRGLHWQAAPHTQAKLVRVIRGAVWDVVVDIRAGSPTFGQHVAETLSAENHRQLYVPRGFAHGFIVLENDTLFSYKCDNLYSPSADRGLRFDDPALNISWPEIGLPLTLSEKDQRHPLFKDIAPWSPAYRPSCLTPLPDDLADSLLDQALDGLHLSAARLSNLSEAEKRALDDAAWRLVTAAYVSDRPCDD